MADFNIRALNGEDRALSREVLDGFLSGIRGVAVTETSPEYDASRQIWNAMIEKRPALIIRAAGQADILRTINFAREHELLLAVRGGGHNIAGKALCDGGVVLDLSALRGVHVDPQARTVRVEPGATLGDMDHETQAFGLATPLGINSTTGVAGLTLGGGFGWLTRKFGMTVDNLVSAEVVTSDGDLRKASETSEPDLFWAIRGGGGNFGVVTSFEFRLHPVGPEVLSGLIFYPLAEAPQILRRYRDFVAEMPEELSVWAVLRKAPPLPFLPESAHGTEVLALALMYAGDPETGWRAVEPLEELGTPIGKHVGVQPYTAFQAAFDPLLTPGARNYWKSQDLATLNDAVLETVVDYAWHLPSDECEIFIASLGGAMARVPSDATAYAGRDANFVMNVHTRWRDAAADGQCRQWARAFSEAVAPNATGGVYVNFLSQDEADRVHAAYGGNYERLAGIKVRYDPANLFRNNQNIAPAGSGQGREPESVEG
ncbi:FAD-linked oxidase [Thiohalorhabdus denitrificans]|uniref:FAD/FMN-containing dehydrogenase n=1 Tax=Thiohalorhabdus denitrificans TaxID=381306 RepID=A0A0P9CFR6_9GAMM|nr:FAD-binding oxidoreductase [Thiohalorhabdus denitrificans]KPV41856.1 FAD-linked oxidase [Thiohalorhabdus denitrificans]SCY64690.1 FAD/FMN-containing dehydrogenase [Thiohalorhabdus denitrificans]